MRFYLYFILLLQGLFVVSIGFLVGYSIGTVLETLVGLL